MRLQLLILTAIYLFLSLLFVFARPAWAGLEPIINQPSTLVASKASNSAYNFNKSALNALSATATPTTPHTAVMPTSTVTTTALATLFIPALVDTGRIVLAGDPVEPCGPTKRPSPTIDAEATSTPAPTVTPSVGGAITVTPSLTPSLIVTSTVCPPNVYEAALAEFLINSPLQQRTVLTYHPVLAQVARNHAMDMAMRDYFGSVDPNGIGPNYRVRQAGYELPDYYGDELNANNLETTIAGFTTPEEAWNALSANGGNIHAIGNHEGYRDQTDYGIGYAYVDGSTHERYWVIIIAKLSDTD